MTASVSTRCAAEGSVHLIRRRPAGRRAPMPVRHGQRDRPLGLSAGVRAVGRAGRLVAGRRERTGANLRPAPAPTEARAIDLQLSPRRGRDGVGALVGSRASSGGRVSRVVHVNEILDVYGGLAARIAGVPCVWHVRADISSWPFPLRSRAAEDRGRSFQRDHRRLGFGRGGGVSPPGTSTPRKYR